MVEVTSAARDAISAAWTRWQRYQQLHDGREKTGVADMEVQFELVATGLILRDEQIQELFTDDAAQFVAILTPLPAFKDDVDDMQSFHFTFVSAAVLLDQYLQLSNRSKEQVEDLLGGRLTDQVLLPVLQHEYLSLLHDTALRILRTLLNATTKKETTVTLLFNRVQELLIKEEKHMSISYDSLCSLLQLLLEQKVEQMTDKCMEICAYATRQWRQQPQFLRAVGLYLVPPLVKVDSDVNALKRNCVRLLEMVVDVWTPLDESRPHELLYLICVLVPKAPQEVIAHTKLQRLVCFALRHKDALIRKQGLHILKVAFSHCVVLSEVQKLTAKEEKRPELWLETWQKFLTASEVIQMHHEQHLIEQVWPQVAGLLTSYLVIFHDSKQQLNSKQQWPVELSFDWMQSLLVRLFSHDNPVVKRLFLSNFMDTCVRVWQAWANEASASKSIDRKVSFACAYTFERFVLDHLLRACNDPVLFKHAHRAQFQALVAEFLVSFLAFQFTQGDEKRVLDDFVAAMEVAVFGEGSDSHSSEALLSMLQVFQARALKLAVSSASTTMLLSESAVDKLRYLLDVHAMQSFSQAMRMKMLHALSHALTGGYVNVSTLSLSVLARVLCVFPTRSLMADAGTTMLQVLRWVNVSPAVGRSSSFSAALASALEAYLTPQAEETPEKVRHVLSPTQLARLLLFTASGTCESTQNREDAKLNVVLRGPLSALLPESLTSELSSTRLVLVIATFEEQVQELLNSLTSLPSQDFTFSFRRSDFYSGRVNCSYVFRLAMTVVRHWLDQVSSTSKADGLEPEDHEKEDIMEAVESAAFVLAQMCTHTDTLHELTALDALCDELKELLATAMEQTVFDLALAAKCLAIVASNAAAIDSLRAFESERILPLVLALDTSRRYKGKLEAKYAIRLAATKWSLLHDVMKSSSFIDTKLLQTLYDACVVALPTAGMDPSALIQIVSVLSLTLSQLVSPASNGIFELGNLLEEVWAWYIDSKAKPDALTRAVVTCVFQPVFLLRKELKETMKHWIAEFIRFGSRHRPNVVFHLACRLCQTWRAHPASALSFADELVELLLYKEPVIDEKEQLSMDTCTPFHGFQDSFPRQTQTMALASCAKDRFVRLIMLSLLNDVAVDTSASSTSTQQLMDVLVTKLLTLNATPDWQKQHMLNSEGFGKKLRSWQALCIISAHVTKTQLTALLPTLQIAFAVPQLPSVRYYMELFGMRIATRYPRETCSGLLLPMLRDPNLMPQVGVSVLLVSTYLATCKLDEDKLDVDSGELLETMLPWLNSSHGHTRVLAQCLLAKVLPRHIHQLRQSSNDTPGLRFLEGTARYLSNNKECKRMLRRQARQLEKFHPDYESSLLGMLSSGFISEFGELLPRDEALRLSEQFKAAMNELYAQYQREHFAPDPAQGNTRAALSSASETTSGALTVQRKMLLLEDSVLPAAMRTDLEAARCGETLNARQRPRQPIIVCASLVDKIPNLAGLARTCEIFNAQKLIVPNLRMTEQDATFATVSATAHKWMPLEEVRPQGDDLYQALLRWKSDGYTIVAVEQTGSSVSLANYTMPRKMVLVLGREKEGIPVDVLQLVDVCVEIPQFGLVRSLNVHVSGALMLWEYTQQQLMSGALESTLN